MAKKILIQVLLGLAVFLITAIVCNVLAVLGASSGLYGPASLASFVLLLLATVLFLKQFTRLGEWGIWIIMAITIVLTVANFPSLRFTSKMMPLVVSWVLGIISGWFYYKFNDRRRFWVPAMLALFPLVLNFTIYDLWVHKVEFGSFSGNVSSGKVIPFSLPDKNEQLIDNESLKGKIVLLDFWFIGCGPCYVKFPDLQRIYEKYSSDDRVAIYAINRAMPGNKPGQAFEDMEKRDYTFPVLLADQQVMDDFDVYKYPTVILLDPENEVVFMGRIEAAEKELEKLLSQ